MTPTLIRDHQDHSKSRLNLAHAPDAGNTASTVVTVSEKFSAYASGKFCRREEHLHRNGYTPAFAAT
jgi:hypothetical protein